MALLMISIKTIAEKCNVSVATVSKALNGHNDIGDETKVRIKRTADELGYLPNAAARALKTNRTYSIGVLFEEEAGSGLTHEYFSGVLNGLKLEVEKNGYDILFISSNFENNKLTYYEHCKYRNLDGIAIVCADYKNKQVHELMEGTIPVVTIDYVHYNCTAVCSNNIQGIEDLLRYIYSKGHRKIAYIHGQSDSYVTKERLASFYRTMDSLGIEVPDKYIETADYIEITKTAVCTKKLLELHDPPTCIIYPDDTALLGGMNVIKQLGLQIPKDISIAGYDGSKMSQLLYPTIATIKQDAERIGTEAARRLICNIEKPKIALVERVIIEGMLLKGQSIANLEGNQ